MKMTASFTVSVCMLVVILAATVTLVAGCSGGNEGLSDSQDLLQPDRMLTADLDGDEVPESILLDPADRSLTILDGELVYHSRDRWQVFQATLGDTDHDGLPEVVTLLDSEAGRHLGLFAYFKGQYRERIVTAAISPSPSALEIVDWDKVKNELDVEMAFSLTGDVVVLVYGSNEAAASGHRTILRWNGFGFTRIDIDASP